MGGSDHTGLHKQHNSGFLNQRGGGAGGGGGGGMRSGSLCGDSYLGATCDK